MRTHVETVLPVLETNRRPVTISAGPLQVPPSSHTPVAEAMGMTNAAVRGRQFTISDCQPIRCVLEMTADGEIDVIVQPGCSVADVHEMLRWLVGCGGQFDHVTFVDTDEALA